MKPKRPKGRYWTELDERWGMLDMNSRRFVGIPPNGRMLVVISTLDGDEHHITISAALPEGPERATDYETEFALTAFGMHGATEEAGGPPPVDRVRHFWRRVAQPAEPTELAEPQASEPDAPPE